MLGDRERTQLQETGELTVEPRVSVFEIVDLLSDLGLILGDDAHLVECMTNYGLGFRLTTTPPQEPAPTQQSEGEGKSSGVVEAVHTLASTIGRARLNLREPVEAEHAAAELRDAAKALGYLRVALVRWKRVISLARQWYEVDEVGRRAMPNGGLARHLGGALAALGADAATQPTSTQQSVPEHSGEGEACDECGANLTPWMPGYGHRGDCSKYTPFSEHSGVEKAVEEALGGYVVGSTPKESTLDAVDREFVCKRCLKKAFGTGGKKRGEQ